MAKFPQFRTHAWLAVLAATLCCLLSVQVFALPPQLQLDARMRTADDAIVNATIAPGAVLRSGDEVRIRVTARADGHLYVIALGSSGTAELLHPFLSTDGDAAQGNALSAPVRNGDMIAVPSDGGYLPLDDRLGQEMIVAFVAETPVESLTRLMFRMEGLFEQPAAAREVLASEGFELAHVSFAHAAPAVANAPAPVAATPAADLSSTSADDSSTASAPAIGREGGVLGGLGSRIAQFIGQPTSQERDDAVAAPAESSSNTDEQPSSVTTRAAPSTQGSSFFSRWFGTGEKSADIDPSAVTAAQVAPEVQKARTFALPQQQQAVQKEPPPRVSSSTDTQPALPTAAKAAARRASADLSPEETSVTVAATNRVVDPVTADTKSVLGPRPVRQPRVQVPAPTASTHVELEEETAPVVATGRMVAPLPVEATLYPSGKLPSEPQVATKPDEPDVPAGGRVQRTLSRLFDGGSADDVDKVKPGVAAPGTVSGETPVVADPVLREEPERAAERAAKSDLGADASPRQTESISQSLAPVEEGSESEADGQAVDVPAEVVISRPADAAQQAGGWFSALGALFSPATQDVQSNEEASSGAEVSINNEQAIEQDAAAPLLDRNLIVQPIETRAVDERLEPRDSASTSGDQTVAIQSGVAGESALLSGLDRKMPVEIPTQRSPETESPRSVSAAAAPQAAISPWEQSGAAAAPNDSQGGGLLAGFAALFGGGATSDAQAQTPTTQPAPSTQLAALEERAVSAPPFPMERPVVESNEPVLSSVRSGRLAVTQQDEETAQGDEKASGLHAGVSALSGGETTDESEPQPSPSQVSQWQPATGLAVVEDRTVAEQRPAPRFAAEAGEPEVLSGLGRQLPPVTYAERSRKAAPSALIAAPVVHEPRAEWPAPEQLSSTLQDVAAKTTAVGDAPAPVDERSRLVASSRLQNETPISPDNAVQALRPKSEGTAPVEERSLGIVARGGSASESPRASASLGEATQPAGEVQNNVREASPADGDGELANALMNRDSGKPFGPSTDTGLFADLGRLFLGSESSDSVNRTTESLPSNGNEVATHGSKEVAVAGTRNEEGTALAEVAQDKRADVEAVSEGGLLAGIGALLTNPFASSEPELTAAPDVQAQATVQAFPQSVDKDAANGEVSDSDDKPRIERRVERDGKKVVVLGGLPVAKPEREGNLQVLEGAGSRIRRLLDEPEPKTDFGPGTEAATLTTAPAAVEQSAPLNEDTRAAAPLTSPQQAASLTAAQARAAVPNIEIPLASVDVNSEGGVASSVVLVITPAGNTSGVIIDRKGYLLTNWHSVNRFDEVVVMFKQARGSGPRLDEPMRARVVAHSKFADLALLKVETLPAGVVPAALIAEMNVQSGAPIHAIGPAAGRGGNAQWRHDVASVDRVLRGSSWYSAQRILHRADVIRAEMNPVHDVTGAPLFNNQLELVGLGAMVRIDKGEIIGVSAATIRAFLAAAS